jgi:two-component system, NarL family, response regulator LiaR
VTADGGMDPAVQGQQPRQDGAGPIRVMIVDDHGVVRQGLRFLVEQEPGIEVVGEFGDGASAVAAIPACRPDVLLLDLLMPGMDGLGVLAAVKPKHPALEVVVLTSLVDDDHLLAAIRAGAISYLHKTASADDVVAAIRAAARGESALTTKIATRLLGEVRRGPSRRPTDQLSPRELEVLTGLGRGRSNRELARALGIGEETVKTHVSSILAKLNLADRTQAAIFALQQGLVPLDEALNQ